MSTDQHDSERDTLEALADEFAQRCRGGSCPSVSQYAARYPELSQQIGDLFPAIAMLERLSRQERNARADSKHRLNLDRRLAETIGDYRIVREIGRGGMGIVYEAVQESLGRTVALKVLSANAVTSPRQLQRFRREAQAAARLHHTNIVPVFGVGEDDGLHYYVMQFIDGQALDRTLAQRPPHEASSTHPSPPSPAADGDANPARPGQATEGLAWHTIAEYGLQIARAVDYAHRHGVLHRDIKPGNLLVDSQGTVWITDFGLAKVFGDDSLTRSGDLFGTLRYMAPEQFDGRSTEASDIYSIGITLYEMATRQTAFDESDVKALMRCVTRQGPARPRTINPRIPRDLETIILKAAAFEPGHRYATAADLADDLQRFVCAEPITARRMSAARRWWLWSRRNPAIATLSGLSFLLLLLTAVVAIVGYVRVDEARREAVTLATLERKTAAELRLANKQVVNETLRARAEFQRAEDNLRLAMKAFEEIVQEVSHRRFPSAMDLDLEEETPRPDYPPVSGADAELLQSLLTFYVEFAQRNDTNKAVQLETAKAHQRIGDIRLRLGQFEMALTAYNHALSIYQSLSRQSDPDLQLLLATVDACNQRGIALAKAARIREAVAAHLDAKDLLEQQTTAVSETPECRFALAQTWNLIGALSPRSDLLGGLPSPGPGRRFGPAGMGGPRRIGNGHWLEEGRQATLANLQQLIAVDPANAEYRLALARCHRNCLNTSRQESGVQDSARSLQEAIRILDRLTSDFPDNARYAFELADILSIDTPELRTTDFGKAAEQRLNEAVNIAARLHNASPYQTEYQVLLATAQFRLGMVLYRRGELDASVARLAEATRHFEELLDQFPSVAVYVAAYSRAADDLATLQRDADQLEASRETLENAILRLLACSYSDVDMRIVRRSAAGLYGNLNRTLNVIAQQ